MKKKRSPDSKGIYQKPEDLATQRAVAARFSDQVGYTCNELPTLHHADYRLTSLVKDGIQETVGFLEVRRRLIKSTKYKTVMVGQPKYEWLQTTGRKLNVPVFFVFVYNDRSLFFNVTTAPEYPIRKAQGRGNCTIARCTDYELSYYISVNDLQPFG